MKHATLDGSHATMDAVYEALQRQLDLPAHFGRNLDALWDALTKDVAGPVEIVWRDYATARAHIGPPLDRLADVLRDAAAERPDLRVRIE